MEQLSNATLHKLPSHIPGPGYDRSAVPTRIVHLGAGSFHRSHQAAYTDTLMNLGDAQWGIAAVSLRNAAIVRALQPQDGLYTLATTDNETTGLRVVGSLNQVLCLADARAQVLALLSAPQTAIVSLTITEKGYCYNAEQNALNLAHPDVQLDINSPQNARSTIGLLAWAIYQRKLHKLKPFTLLSCDHIPANGKVLQSVLEHYIQHVQDDLQDPDLLQYFLDQYACPCTLVDRIAPTRPPGGPPPIDAMLGLYDASPIITEPYSQWIIQDWFSADRPRWDEAGAVFSAHVAPYEQARDRLLDATYLALAYLGLQAGFKTAAAALQTPELSAFADALMDDAIATLDKHTGVDARRYKHDILQRLANPALGLTTSQLGMDGSQALPAAILEPCRLRLARGLPIERHALVLAAWLRCLTGRNERGEAIDISDPLADTLRAAIDQAGGRSASAHDLVDAVLPIDKVFGHTLPRDIEFDRAFTAALQSLESSRVLGSLTAGQPST